MSVLELSRRIAKIFVFDVIKAGRYLFIFHNTKYMLYLSQ